MNHRYWDKLFSSSPLVGFNCKDMYLTGHMLVKTMEALGVDWDGATVLDMGCGNGRVAASLTEYDNLTYYGIDVNQKSIAWLQENFKKPDGTRCETFTFSVADVENGYYPSGKGKATEYHFPLVDNSIDVILMVSVFTHLETLESCQWYMSEIKRLLKSGGHLYATFFRTPPNLRELYDSERTVLREADIMNLIAGLEVVHSESGMTDERHDQWRLLLKK